MKKTIRTIICAAVFAMLAVSCQEGVEEAGPEARAKGKIEIKVSGLMGEYAQTDATKASLVNNIRVSWEGGETVYVFDGTKCLGSLNASIDGDDRYALLSTDETHTVETPSEGTTQLTLVYSPLLKAAEVPEVIDGVLSISLAVQDGEETPFVACATLDYNGGKSITDAIVPFKFATSVIRVNCTGLKANTAIMSATLSDVNTVCSLTLSGTAAPTVSGDVNGNIVRTGGTYFSAGKVNSEGEAVFQIAVPVLSAGVRELALLQESGKYEDVNFSQSALEAAKSVNTVCQLSVWKGTVTFDVQGHGVAPAPIKDLDYWSKISAPEPPVADYFQFSGWYKEADCLNAWDFAADQVTDNITLYARWDPSRPVGTLPGKFTVDSNGKQVYFAKGNLWHDFTKNRDQDERFYFYLEDSQWHSLPFRDSIWRSYHENHFHWSDDWACVVSMKFKDNVPPKCNCVFFTNKTETTPNSDVSFTLVVDGLKQNGIWRVLSSREWEYLLNERPMKYNKPRYTNRTDTVYVKGGKVTNIYKGIFIYPDDYNSDEVAKESGLTWRQIDSAGIVFLAANGVRLRDTVVGVNINRPDSYYWTSRAHESDSIKAYGLKLSTEGIRVEATRRDEAHAVRVVRDCNP